MIPVAMATMVALGFLMLSGLYLDFFRPVR